MKIAIIILSGPKGGDEALGPVFNALAVAQEAMSLAASGGPVGLSGEIAARLELYRQKKPFRETDRRSAGGRP